MRAGNTIPHHIILLSLTAVLLVSLSACGGGKQSDGTVTPAPVVSSGVATESPAAETPIAATVQPTDGAALAETEDMGQEYIDKIIFLGDSTTYGLRAYSMLSGGKDTTQVWTPASGTLTLSNQSFATIVYPPTGAEIPIRDAVKAEMPEMMVITLGVNGVSFLKEDGFKSEYTALVNDIKTISPDTKIILQSILPVESDYKYLADINNDKIAAANGWVEDIAEATGVKYLDTYPLLLGSDGFMDENYGNGDGIHLCSTGFEVVLQNIRTHGYK